MDGFKNFKAQAVIFDKDGTLIDFDVMWGGWVVYLAGQLNAASGLNVEEPFYVAMGYDHEHRKVLAGGRLASRPMAQLRHLTIEVMQSFGLNMDQAEQIVEQARCIFRTRSGFICRCVDRIRGSIACLCTWAGRKYFSPRQP